MASSAKPKNGIPSSDNAGSGFWVTPCGYEVPPSNSEPSPDSELAGVYYLTLQLALDYADHWKDDFVIEF